MAIEIERRFIIRHNNWKQFCTAAPSSIIQGYIAKGDAFVVRVRIVDSQARLTLKGKKHGMRLSEYEYAIPLEDAREMLDTIAPVQRIEKSRYHVMHEGHLWEIDEFFGENIGLCIAEVELEDEKASVVPPFWVDEEVTHDDSYSNYALSQKPYGRR